MSATQSIVVGNLPEPYRKEISTRRAYLANITEIEHTRTRTYGGYIIAGKKPGEQFSLTEIVPARGTMDYGDKHVVDFPIMPEEIAADLEREINADAGQNSFLGVFVCGPAGPTKTQLEKAHARLESFYQWCVAEGDREWQRYGRVAFICDLFKNAVKHLKLKREWASEVQPQLECPACANPLKPGVAICMSCGATIDEEKARKFFPERFATAATAPPTQPATPASAKDKPKS